MRQTYLREHRPGLYNDLILNGTLYRQLAEVDQTCYDRVDLLVRQMAKREVERSCTTTEAVWAWQGIGSAGPLKDGASQTGMNTAAPQTAAPR